VRLRRRVLARCTEPAIRDAGFPPPFDPDELAGRLERTCRANALALLGRGADALGATATPACLGSAASPPPPGGS
jgi:hypothetical protein